MSQSSSSADADGKRNMDAGEEGDRGIGGGGRGSRKLGRLLRRAGGFGKGSARLIGERGGRSFLIR
jgi:hypothetical protein